MKEYLPKNPNEYLLDGKRYLEEIRCCNCAERQDGAYILKCLIHQRGRHEYDYMPGEDRITKRFNNQRGFFLSADALHTVEAAVAAFQNRVEETEQWGAVQVSEGETTLEIRYQVNGENVRYFLASGLDKTRTERFFEGYDAIHWMLSDARDLLYRKNREANREKMDAVHHSSRETICNNPVYAAAISQGEDLFAKILKLHYGITDRREEACLSERFGWRLLPQLPEDFNRDYYVDADTIDREDCLLLYRSGYGILHRPYFAMKGSTHKMFTLNPHKKSGVDAAPVGAEAITFREYLGMFNIDRR